MSDPVVRSSALALSTTASTSLAASMPAGFIADDLLLAIYLQRGSTAAATDPSGWTRIGTHASGSGRACDVWGKVAVGGETLTLTKPTTDAASIITVAIQTGTYDDVTWTEGYTTLMAQGSDASPPLPDSTTTVNGALAISAAGIRNGSGTSGSGLTAPGTWTSLVSGFCHNGTNGMAVGGCAKTITTAGSTGAYDWSSPLTNSGPEVTFAVRPSPGTAGAVTAEVYWWDSGSSDYVLADGVRDWRTASSDYLPTSGFDEVRCWDAPSGTYVPAESGTPVDVTPPTQPGAVTTSNITTTTITFSWVASTDTVGVTGYRIRLNGGAWVDTTDPTYPATGLTPSTSYTPEIQATDAAGNWSTTQTGSATSTVAAPDVTPPTQPGQPSASTSGSDVALTWTASTDAVGVTAYDVHRSATTGFTPTAGTLKSSPVTNSYTETNVPNGTWFYKIVARDAAGNSSTASTQRSVTLTPSEVPVVMLMGVSHSTGSNGGTQDWDGFRVYNRSTLYSRANQTGINKPLFLAYSKAGANMSGSYASIYADCIEELDTFYYGNAAGTLGSGTGSSTPSIRSSQQLFWSNGNENSDKGDLSTPHTAAGIAAYTTSMRALYDACMYDPGSGRRFPNAYAGSNPTQDHEFTGIVADWLHPSAQYHHFVMWSMYPGGRTKTDTDPTYNWPSFVESQRTVNPHGFLIRCFYRTAQARAQARADTGDPTFDVMIGCGEVGIASDPGDPSTRPYYVVHGLAGAMFILADQYDLSMPFACWWDDQIGPHNILRDEGPTSDHGNAGTPNPTTTTAWKGWLAADHRRGGSHPAQWSGNPKSSWKSTGTPV